MKADVKHTVVVLINRVAEFSRKITTAFSAAEPRESSGCVYQYAKTHSSK